MQELSMPSKHKNKKQTIYIENKPVTFDSMAEADRYIYLSLRQEAGEISGLICQKKHILQEKFTRNGKKHREIAYTSDFEYNECLADGRHISVIEDVKGVKTPLYRLKVKMFLKHHGETVRFLEVFYKRGKLYSINEL